jgi:hypothetical protein
VSIPLIIGIDPGASRIGVGLVFAHTAKRLGGTGQIYRDAVEVWKIVTAYCEQEGFQVFVVVEDFQSGGVMNTAVRDTLHQVGFFKYVSKLNGVTTHIAQPGARVKSRRWAYEQLGYKFPQSHDPDDASALAHAKSEYERLRQNGAF